MVRAHSLYYAAHWGLGPGLEVYVAAGMAEFMARYRPGRDLILHAETDGAFAGSVFIDGADAEAEAGQSRLRWFIVTEAAQGRGLGRRLLERAVAFSDDAGFARSFLTTFEGLDAARHLYESAGYRLTAEIPGEPWGRPVVEQRFDRP